MAKRIVSIGDLVLDLIMTVRLPVFPGEHQEPGTRRVEPGGAGNFTIAARHMGLAVSAAGTVGADGFGDVILEALHAEEVDTTCVVRVPGSTSTVVVVLTDPQSGEHTFIGSYGGGPPVPYPAALDGITARADAIFIQGYTLSEKRIVTMAFRAIEQAQRVPVYLDVGPFMEYVDARDITRIVHRSAVILMTEDEIPLVSGGRQGRDAWAYLLDQGPDLLVIKQGPAGCTVVGRDGMEQVPGFAVPVMDTVGAGDCFDAAFVAARLNGLSLWDSARLANGMGAAAVQRVGAGRSAPTCDDVLALVQASGDRIDFPC